MGAQRVDARVRGLADAYRAIAARVISVSKERLLYAGRQDDAGMLNGVRIPSYAARNLKNCVAFMSRRLCSSMALLAAVACSTSAALRCVTESNCVTAPLT